MQFLTIEQLAERLATEGETTQSVVRRIRDWKETCPDFPYYQGRPGGKLRFVFGEVAEWLRRQSVAAAPTRVYPFEHPRTSGEIR